MEEFRFDQLKFSRASEYIEKQIKQAIIDGKLKTGDKLPTEKEMATQFGVSVVTLREALRGLEIFGLIQKKKGFGGGIFISDISSKSVKASLGNFLSFKDLSPQHLYEVRKIIEPSSIKLAGQNITPDEISKIEENVSYCEKKLINLGSFLNEEEFFDLDQKNNDFHRLIAEGTHNPILSLTIDYIFDFLWECETNILVADLDYSKANIEDHRNILEYLKQRDLEKCEEKMLQHLRRLDEYLIEKVKRVRGSDDIVSLNAGRESKKLALE
jgi:GntR family transcriptional repressor for pyruvate dehydrogenase complex